MYIRFDSDLNRYYKYEVKHFAGEECGLLDEFMTNDWSEVEEEAHRMISEGGFLELTNNDSGIKLLMSYDNYFDEFEGEFPIQQDWME